MSVNTIVCANALHLPYADESVNCVVTSPPYYGLRDYGTAQWAGGDPNCDHRRGTAELSSAGHHRGGGGLYANTNHAEEGFKEICGKCGARRIDNQLGLEATPAAYIERIVAVFREARRVLRDDGVAWVNMGDSYCGSPPGNKGDFSTSGLHGAQTSTKYQDTLKRSVQSVADKSNLPGLKPKDLMMMPARVAIALQDDGWYLRSEIVWAKPNPMPESVSDRCTKSHEMVYMLTKQPRYWYDGEAIREEAEYGRREGTNWARAKNGDPRDSRIGVPVTSKGIDPLSGRNRRSVWTAATEPTPFAHFATFPRKLIEPMILAGCPERVCAVCGAPWVRVVERQASRWNEKEGAAQRLRCAGVINGGTEHVTLGVTEYVKRTTLGFRPTCDHAATTRPGIVLDMFMGSGTVALVARSLGRDYIGCDLSPAYIDIARERLRLPFEQHHIEQNTRLDDLPLFVSLKGND